MTNLYSGHRFPAEIISYCVWLYHTFLLRFRDSEKMRLYRGITVTYEAIRGWCLKFSQGYANQIRKQRPKPGDNWHIDEVVIKIKGEQFYLWRAVDQHGVVLDILMQRRRNKVAAKKFFRKLLKEKALKRMSLLYLRTGERVSYDANDDHKSRYFQSLVS